jgi:predicted RNA-binding Zn ribbon-like protein
LRVTDLELLFLDFLNSDVRDYLGSGRRTDRLRDPEWLTAFLTRWGLEDAGQPGRATLAELVELRAAMRRVAEAAIAGREAADEDVEAISAALSATTLRRRLVRDGATYRVDSVAARHDWAWAKAEIAASFADLLANQDVGRLKTCGNPDCGWAFYDESKSRTRRWCADACGNLVKVRRFRSARR